MRPIPQSGAIAFLRLSGSTRVLLVRARRNPSHWIFPKGHVEEGESEEDAALRELLEEGGARGDVVAPAGALEYDRDGRRYRVAYFLIRARMVGPGAEDREQAWLGVDEALERLSHDDARALLRRAIPLIGDG